MDHIPNDDWARDALCALLAKLVRQAGEEMLRDALLLTAAAARCMGRRP